MVEEGSQGPDSLPVPATMREMAEQIDVLAVTIATLHGRLAPVLSVPPPDCPPPVAMGAEQVGPLATEMTRQCKQIQALAQRVAYILDHLEV